ncbi:hypothetical protein ACFLYA_03070 [Candidatus Dependentiae bacterium]
MGYKKYFIFIFLFSTCVQAVDVTVTAQNYDKLNIKVILVGNRSIKLDKIVSVIKRDLEFSGQFDVIVCPEWGSISRTSDIAKHFSADCQLGIFLTKDSSDSVGWRLYDLESALMIKGQTYNFKGHDFHGWAHNISDEIWPNLTGEKGFFSTKIAYCKDIERAGKKSHKHVYVADYDGSNEQLLVATPTVNVAPRWNNDPRQPLLFYSEHTNKNVRLMVVDMRGKRKIASNFDGLNILSAFSPDGRRFAYCASRGDGFCQIYYYDGELKKLTQEGNNISPTFADNGNSLYFCSDAHSKGPQIYKYDLRRKDDAAYQPEHVLKNGFEVSTAFCPEKNLLAYAKMVAGTMQVFVYNLNDGSHKQLTFSAGDKEECSWSPCGNYLLFSVEKGNKSRIATLNLLTGKMKFITPASHNCLYPSWSPEYELFPCVVT